MSSSRRSSTDGLSLWDGSSFAKSAEPSATEFRRSAPANASGYWTPVSRRFSTRDTDFSASSSDFLFSEDRSTATERMEFVENDPHLKAMLSSEVEKEGVVTSAAYRAVHQRFLYSDVVEKELDASEKSFGAERKPSGKMAMRQSIGSLLRTASVNASAFSQSISQFGNDSQRTRRRSSSTVSSFNNFLRKESGDTLITVGEGERDVNIAPVKDSVVMRLPEHLQQELLDDEDSDDDLREWLQRTDSEDEDSLRSLRESFKGLHRSNSETSLELEDVFDGADGARTLERQDDLKKPQGKPAHALSDGLTATCATFQSKSEYTELEECSWLPWPKSGSDDEGDYPSHYDEEEEDDVASSGEDLLEPFCPSRRSFRPSSPSREETKVDVAFLPTPLSSEDSSGLIEEDLLVSWPDRALNSNRARAA